MAAKTKKEKTFKAKKLPGLFKKSYKTKVFDKKISSKLYVPADKKYVTDLFKPSKDKKGNDILAIPADTEFTKAELKRLKTLAKEIKANKSRINAAAFIAVAVVIAVIGLTVTIFKNTAAKAAIKGTMQGIFGAKCDIGSVNIEFFNSRLTVNSLAQASSDDEMKNIFQFDRLDLDFNLTQLLRGRFDAENIEITGIAVKTDRTVSGKLPVKPKTAREKEEKNDSTGFYDSLKEKCGTDTDAAKDAIAQLFAMYDPQTITANLKDNLQTQQTAKEVEEELKVIIEKWKNKPDELKKTAEDLKTKTKKISSLDVSKVKTAAEATALIKEIESLSKDLKSAKDVISSSVSGFDSDRAAVDKLQKKLKNAVEADKALINNSLSVLDVNKAKEAVNSAINNAGYALLGQYYPYLKQLVSYAGSMKSSGSDKKEADKAVKQAKTKAKKESKRYAGRYVYWKEDPVPRFLIEKAHGSGNGINITASDISSDMNKRGKPWVISGSGVQSERTHNASLIVDSRSNSDNPLLTGTYSGNNFPLTFDLAKNSEGQGVPKFEGKSVISAKLTAESDFSFAGSGSLSMKPCVVTASPLSNETADRIYSNALASIKSLNAGAEIGFSEKNGVKMNITTDFAKLLSDAVSKVASSELDNIKADAIAKINEQISSDSGAGAYLAKFNDISKSFADSKAGIDSINSTLENKKKELSKKAASGAAEKAGNAAGSLLNKLKK